jgi:IS5 family transposase
MVVVRMSMCPTDQDITDLTSAYEAKYAANMNHKYTDFPWQRWLAQHEANTVYHEVFHLPLTTETYKHSHAPLCINRLTHTHTYTHAHTHTHTHTHTRTHARI